MKVCIIGCGAVARRVQIPVFRSLRGVQVASIVDTNEDLARKVSQEFGIKKFYTDYREALDDDEVELVSICTPSSTHAEMIIQASRMGKNILVEKPLTIELDEGKTALKAVKDEKVQLCVVFNYRMVPAVRETRRKIKLGKIARIVSMVGISHTPFPVSWTGGKWLYHYGGALDDFGPHLIDLILWLNPSKLEAVSALGGDFTGDFGFISQIQVNMKFRDTSVAVADISWLTDLTLFDLSVYGTAGSLSCDVRNNYHNETHGRILSPLEDLASTSKKSFNVVKSVISGEYFRGSLAYHSQIISEYMQSIKDKSKPPISGEEALLVTAVSAAAKQSLRTGRTVLIDDIMK